MQEVETKFRFDDWDSLQNSILNMGGSYLHTERNEDCYYNSSVRDFKLSDEVLRIRKLGDISYLTYKGPKRVGPVKSRTEWEVPIQGEPHAKTLANILSVIGFHPSATVKKIRQLFGLQVQQHTVHFCFDEVEGLGKFVEVEIVADEANLETAQKIILDLTAKLKLPAAEKRSYLAMILEKQHLAEIQV